MNPVIVLNTLRERCSSPIVIIILALIGLVPRIVDIFTGVPSFPQPDSHILAAWILGAGIIGKEVRSGVLQLVFVRPVTRSEYVWSKYFALVIAVFAFSFFLWIVSCAIFLLHHSDVSFQGAFTNLADHLILAFGIAAVIVFLSSLRSGYSDVGIAVLLYLMIPLLRQVGTQYSFTPLVRASTELQGFLNPGFSVTMFSREISWFPVFSYFSTVTLCLALAIVVLNQKELSYAE